MSRRESLVKQEAKSELQAVLDGALIKAVGNRDEKKVLELLKQGASASAQGDGGESLLILMIRGQEGAVTKDERAVRILDALLSYGANPNEASARGQRALHLACFFGLSEFVWRLLANGAEVNAVDNEGDTAAHGVGGVLPWNAAHESAINTGALAIIRLMGEAGADFKMSNAHGKGRGLGKTPIRMARERELESVALEMEAFEAFRERRVIGEHLTPLKSKDRKASL